VKHAAKIASSNSVSVSADHGTTVAKKPTKLKTKEGRRIARHIQFKAKISDIGLQKMKRDDSTTQSSFTLTSLASSLNSTIDEADLKKSAPSKPARRNKAKKVAGNKELAQFKAVMGHSAFQANPFETLKQHLSNTIKPPK
jgi:hypothetical protein